MRVSVVLATRNRAGHIADAVASIVEAASIAPSVDVEIVLVDNGSTDDTPEVVRRLKTSCPVPIVDLVERIQGLSRARNRGIVGASGDVFVFTDDDCRLDAAYFTDLARHYRAQAGPVVRGGRIELGDPTDAPFTIKTDDEPAVLAGAVHPGGFVQGANMTMNREALRIVGLFDERFGAGALFNAAEDTDFAVRAQVAGIPVEYVPDMTVRHLHGRKTPDEVARLSRSYQVGNGALYAKHVRAHPQLLRHLWWSGRNAFYELFGGPLFNPRLKISHAAVFFANLEGMVLYARHRNTDGERARTLQFAG